MPGQSTGRDNSDMDEEGKIKWRSYGEEAIIEASCIKSSQRDNIWAPIVLSQGSCLLAVAETATEI